MSLNSSSIKRLALVGLLACSPFALGSRLFTDGFEENNLTQTMWTLQHGSTVTLQSSVVHSGKYALHIVANAAQPYVVRDFRNPVTSGTYFVRFYLRVASLPASPNVARIFKISNTSGGTSGVIELGNDGRLTVTSNPGTEVAGTTVLTPNTWYCIELRDLLSTTAGELELRVNGTTDATITNTSTIATNVQRLTFGVSGPPLTEDIYFDDIAVNDTAGGFQNSWPGEGKIALVNPAADIAVSWTRSGSAPAGSNFAGVSDVPGLPSDSKSYNSNAGTSAVDRFAFSALPTEIPSNAQMILFDIYARGGSNSTSAGSFAFQVWDENGTNTPGPAFSTAVNGWRIGAIGSNDEHQVFDIGTLARADAQAFNIGYKANSGSGVAKFVTSLWANVEWIEGSGAGTNQAPNGTITSPVGNVSINAGDSVSFAATASDPDNNLPLTSLWNFGSGSGVPNSTSESPGLVQFNSPGTFTVSFTATDSLGLSDPTPDTRVITVHSLGGNSPPDGTITSPSTDVTINVGDTVSFAATGSDPDNNLPLSFQWNFGLGSGAADSTVQSPGSVQFNYTGTFTVTMTATDSLGMPDPTPATRRITVVNPTGNTSSGRVFTTGFEERDLTSTMWAAKVNDIVRVQGNVVHSGKSALHIVASNTGPYLYRDLSSAVGSGTYYFRFYLRPSKRPPSGGAIRVFKFGSIAGSTSAILELDSTGNLELTSGDGSTVNSATSLANNKWYRIELRDALSSTGGQLELLVDGVRDALLTNVNTLPANAQRLTFGVSHGTQTGDFYIDDFAVNRNTGVFQNTWAGAGNIGLVMPASDIAIGWTRAGNLPFPRNWQNVADVPPFPDDSDSYNTDSGTIDVDRFSISSFPSDMPSNARMVLMDLYARGGSNSTTSKSFAFETWNESGSITNGPAFNVNVNGWRIGSIGGSNEHQLFNFGTRTKAAAQNFNVGYKANTGAGLVKRITALWANTEWWQSCPYVRMSQPRSLYLQTSSTLSVSAEMCSTVAGSGIRFVLDGGPGSGGVQMDDYNQPFVVNFSGLASSEHVVDAYLIDNAGNQISGVATHDKVTSIGVGKYYVAMGDSITAATGDDYPADDISLDGRNSGGGYEPILNNLLTSFFDRPVTVVDEGVGGTTSGDGITLLPALLSEHPPAQLYLVLYGMNDARPGNPIPSGLGLSPGDPGYAGSYKDHMQRIINGINASGAQIALAKIPIALGDCNDPTVCPPYPDPNTGARSLNIQQFNKVIDELVADPANNITITPPDFYSYFEAHYQTQYSDNIHPNGIGYQSMANLWFQALTQ